MTSGRADVGAQPAPEAGSDAAPVAPAGGAGAPVAAEDAEVGKVYDVPELEATQAKELFEQATPAAIDVGVGAGTEQASRDERAPPSAEEAAPSTPVTAAEPREPTAESLPEDTTFSDVVGVGSARGFHCSGVVIAPTLVLTAAHCLPATRVAFGSHLAAPAAVRNVSESVAHPQLDAAVLRLDHSVAVRSRPRRSLREPRAPVGVLRMVGFGVVTPRARGGLGRKRRVDLSVRSWGCDRSRARTTGCVPGAEMVVAAEAGRDTCFGDSGGPALERVGQEHRLVAITSRAVAHGGARCGRGGIYVRVDVLELWLLEQGAKR